MGPTITLKRGGDFLVNGVVVGRTYGEPRRWCFMLYAGPPTFDYKRFPTWGWHSRREAAEAAAEGLRRAAR